MQLTNEMKNKMTEEELMEYLERNKWKNRVATIISDWRLYLMLLPLVVVFFCWKYLPMYGLLIAFKDYNPVTGVTESPFVGLFNFHNLMFGGNSTSFWRAFRNTFVLSFYGLLFGFPFPIILALFFSEIKSNVLRSGLQILTYLPKFISTVVTTTIIALLLKGGNADYNFAPGVLSQLFLFLGVPNATDLLRDASAFRAIYHVSGIWEGAGYGSIVYFASIMGISPTNYEAARIDGANKMSQIRYVTLPGMSSTLVIMLILRIGSLLDVGYEKIILLFEASGGANRLYETAEVLSTFSYRVGMQGGQNGVAAASDFFNAIIAMLLVIGSNMISRRVSDTSLY